MEPGLEKSHLKSAEATSGMRQTLKRFTRLSAGYSSVTLLGPLFTILLTPLYTRVLDPADYGVVDVATTLFTPITALVLLGIDQALNALFFDGDAKYQANLITTAVVFIMMTGTVVGIAVTLMAVPLAQFLFKDPARSFIMNLLTLNMVAASIYSVISTGLRLRMGVKYVNTLGLTYLLTTVASNILFILILHFKATGIIAALTLSNLVACCVGVILAIRTLRGRFTQNLLTPLLKTGIGLLPGAISAFLLLSADRVLLTQYVSQNDIGLYSIANKLAGMMFVLVSAAWAAWWPMSLQMANNPDAPRQYGRMFDYFVSGTMIVSLGIGLLAPEILGVFTRSAYVPASPLAMGLLIYFGPITAAASSFQIGIYARKRTHWIGILVFISAAVNIGLNLLLNPIIGVWGAVWATVIAGALLAVMTFIVSQRILPVPYDFRRFGILTFTYLGLITIFLSMPTANTLVYKAIAVLAFMAAILVTGVVTPNQIRIALQSARYRIRRLIRPETSVKQSTP
jgi:O-antigen/teichoic acid export membrane protein